MRREKVRKEQRNLPEPAEAGGEEEVLRPGTKKVATLTFSVPFPNLQIRDKTSRGTYLGWSTFDYHINARAARQPQTDVRLAKSSHSAADGRARVTGLLLPPQGSPAG